jgi:3-hydroxyisobutyrate dehydrogenase
MARRLVSRGFAVAGCDPDAARAAAARDAGVNVLTSPGTVAAQSDLVLSSLPHPAAVRTAYLGPGGIAASVAAGTLVVEVSTIDPATWREAAAAAAARGAQCIDAPVSGGPAEAGSGGLVFLVGGDADVLARCRPVLEALGTIIHHVGPLGSGHIVKVINNVMTMCNVVVAAEAMVLGVKAGIDPQRLFEVLSTTGGRSHHFLKRFPNVLAGDFKANFTVTLSRKDLGLALDMASELGVPMPTAATVRQAYEAARAAGFGDLDMVGVTRLYETLAGVEVRHAGASTRSDGR